MTQTVLTSNSVVEEETWRPVNAATSAPLATAVYTVPRLPVACEWRKLLEELIVITIHQNWIAASMALLAKNLAHVNAESSIILATGKPLALITADWSMKTECAFDA